MLKPGGLAGLTDGVQLGNRPQVCRVWILFH
jgi:hypothetical protein